MSVNEPEVVIIREYYCEKCGRFFKTEGQEQGAWVIWLTCWSVCDACLTKVVKEVHDGQERAP